MFHRPRPRERAQRHRDNGGLCREFFVAPAVCRKDLSGCLDAALTGGGDRLDGLKTIACPAGDITKAVSAAVNVKTVTHNVRNESAVRVLAR